MKVEIEIDEDKVLTDILTEERESFKKILETQGLHPEDFDMYVGLIASINTLLEFYGD